MSRYRRLTIEGGTFFFTVTLADRSSDLLVREADRLRAAYRSVQQRLTGSTTAMARLGRIVRIIAFLPFGLQPDWR